MKPASAIALYSVFRALRVGLDVLLVALVVLVLARLVADVVGADRGHERLDVALAEQRLAQVGDVAVYLLLADVLDRPGGDHRRRGVRAPADAALGVLGEVVLLAPNQRDERLDLVAAETVADVAGPAHLRHLAVVDHVQAGFNLLVDRLLHGAAQAGVEGAVVVVFAAAPGVEHRAQVIGSRQAADVGGEDTVDAAFHISPVSKWGKTPMPPLKGVTRVVLDRGPSRAARSEAMISCGAQTQITWGDADENTCRDSARSQRTAGSR